MRRHRGERRPRLPSDSRTDAGVDRVSTFRKTIGFDRPGDRLFVLLTAGSLPVTRSVVGILSRRLGGERNKM